jgi:CDP-2,3-bis-(O-geranylgeranyl)-sn-glycerol synthase
MRVQIIAEILLLLVIANGTPVIIAILLGTRLDRPLDGNLRFLDGRPLFGRSKTFRGIIGAVTTTTLLAPLFGLAPARGAAFALLAMSGDLLSSFIKRRLGITPGHSAPLLDQLPETLLPLGIMYPLLSASASEALVAVLIFIAIDLLFSHLRERGKL